MKQTQKELVLECLVFVRGQWVSVPDIRDFTGYRGNYADRVQARIWELRQDGHNIEGRYRKQPIFEYRLIEGAA